MVWAITAAGDCSPELEQELAGLIAEILAEKDFGVTATHMGGVSVNGPLKVPPATVKATSVPGPAGA
jgi:hypothetical protein